MGLSQAGCELSPKHECYSKYVAPRQAFVFSIKSLDLLFRALGTHAHATVLSSHHIAI